MLSKINKKESHSKQEVLVAESSKGTKHSMMPCLHYEALSVALCGMVTAVLGAGICSSILVASVTDVVCAVSSLQGLASTLQPGVRDIIVARVGGITTAGSGYYRCRGRWHSSVCVDANQKSASLLQNRRRHCKSAKSLQIGIVNDIVRQRCRVISCRQKKCSHSTPTPTKKTATVNLPYFSTTPHLPQICASAVTSFLDCTQSHNADFEMKLSWKGWGFLSSGHCHWSHSSRWSARSYGAQWESSVLTCTVSYIFFFYCWPNLPLHPVQYCTVRDILFLLSSFLFSPFFSFFSLPFSFPFFKFVASHQ